jgi:prophage antirepressor-like protein
MNAMQNFAFDECLVRAVDKDGNPWFVGKDICTALGIVKHHQALDALDEDERGTCIVGTPSGDQSMIIISEPGVYRLVFRSRKEEAERFKRWLAHEVLPQIRRTGVYAPEAGRAPPPSAFELDVQHAPLSAKTDYLRLVAKLRGREAAVAMMPHIGLPDIDLVLSGSRVSVGGGPECLAHLLEWRNEEGATVRALIHAAFSEQWQDQKNLLRLGLRAVLTGEPGIVIATNHRPVRAIFAGTRWANGIHAAALRGMDGVQRSNAVKFDGHTSQTLFIPSRLLPPPAQAIGAA